MIWTLMKVNMIMLVRDKVSIGLVFILPIIFFSIFAQVFGAGDKDGPTVQIAYVDQDQTDASRRLVQVLGEQSRNLRIMDRPGVSSPLYTPEQIRKVVADGDVPVGLVIPKGFQDELLDPTGKAAPLQLVSDPAQPIALQVAQGVIRKVLFQDMSEVMMLRGIAQLKSATGGLTGRQEKLEELVQKAAQNQIMGKAEKPEQKNPTGNEPKLDSFMIPITTTQVDRKTNEGSNRKLVNYYAAAIGVMFLLFSCVGAAGSLLDDEQMGVLGRLLSTRLGINMLLISKWLFSIMMGTVQLVIMFMWADIFFDVDFFNIHNAIGVLIMSLLTSFACGSFALLLASLCRSRQQLNGISTILILIISAVGGSMVPTFFMPEFMQEIGNWTFNHWAIEGYQQVLWFAPANQGIPQLFMSLWQQYAILLGCGIVFFAMARFFVGRWNIR